MAKRRELDSLFSWVPPRSTVVNVSPRGSPLSRTKTRSNKPSERLHKGINSPKQTEMGRNRRMGQNYNSPGPFRKLDSSKLDDKDSEERIYETLDLPRGNKSNVVDEDLLQEEKVKEAENGLNMWFEMINILDAKQPKEEGLHRDDLQAKATPNSADISRSETNSNSLTLKTLAEEFARRKSVFAFDNIGKNAVDVEGMLKSRKQSENSPSSKFLTISFQNNEGDGDKGDTIQDGVMYAKTVEPKQNLQPGNQARKTVQPEQEQAIEEIENEKKRKSGKSKKDKKKKSKKVKGKAGKDKGKDGKNETGNNGLIDKNDALNGKMDNNSNNNSNPDTTASNGRSENKKDDMASMAARKKSTFAIKPLTETDHVSVDKMLSKSNRTNDGTFGEEKFLSLSWQHENGGVKNDERQGSVYAKNIRKR